MIRSFPISILFAGPVEELRSEGLEETARGVGQLAGEGGLYLAADTTALWP